MTREKRQRRENAKDRLEKQLSYGVKMVKKSFTKTEPLTDHDKERIKREIEILS